RAERRHQRHGRRGVGEDGVGDVLGEHAEDDEVVELERAAEAGEQDDPLQNQLSAISRQLSAQTSDLLVRRSSEGTYIRSTYSLTIPRDEQRGATVLIVS